LTVRGPESLRREHLWISGVPTFIPESENHILMTESSRYLTNLLLAAEIQKAGKPVPKEIDNDQNGMTDWMLRHLQGFLQQDFYEYNGRPYSFEAMQGIGNLYECAGGPRGANPCWRSNPNSLNDPRPRACDVRRAARMVMDYLAARFATAGLGLRRASPYRRQPLQRDYAQLLGHQSDSGTWRYLTYSGGSQVFWNHRYGRLDWGAQSHLIYPLLGAYRVPSLISDVFNEAKGYSYSYFERVRFVRDGHEAVELSYRHPNYLISAGGFFDSGRLSFFSNAENAWALPTTLIPLREGLDYNLLVRIKGAEDHEDRMNTCIAPGFACGLNPTIPSGIPEACMKTKGNWTFLDFDANSPGCTLKQGYFVVVYSEKCDTSACRDAAGDNGTFGFFEVTTHRVGFKELIEDVLTFNNAWNYESGVTNKYRSGGGSRAYEFQPFTGARYKWGMISFSDGASKEPYDQDLRNWPLAQGEMLYSDRHNGCVIFDNKLLEDRLILDFADWNRPRRTRVSLKGAGRECRCGFPDSCLPPRVD
jgi:hypothetical protein